MVILAKIVKTNSYTAARTRYSSVSISFGIATI